MTSKFAGDFADHVNYGSGGGDDIDRANEVAQKFNDDAVSEAMLKAKPQQVVGADGSWPHPDCVDCGEPIPAPRLALGRIRCVDCQARFERAGYMH